MLKKINKPAFFVLIIYPILLSVLFIKYLINYSAGWPEFSVLILGYYGSNIAVGIGLHRLWSHNAYKTNKVIEFILVMISAGTLQGPALSWASNHYKHHIYTDKEQDPHTPSKFDNRLLGFLWAHIGWMLIGEGSYKSIDRVTMVKHGKNKLLKWQLKYYWQLALFMNLLLPLLIGYLFFGKTLFAAYTGFLFIAVGRALQQQATFCVNSLCHFVGSKKYYKGTAGDIWWMALFLLGENWHNFHHAFPSDYRNGVRWYHFDAHKWIIYAMSKLNLAWDLDRTGEQRVKAKMQETLSYLTEKRKQQVSLMQNKIDQLAENLRNKIKDIEDSSTLIQLKKSFIEIQVSLKKISDQLHNSVLLTEKSSEKLLLMFSKKIKTIEDAVYKLHNELNAGKSITN